MDDIIRDLAAAHGHEDLSDEQLKKVKTTLSNSYVDHVLDASETRETPHDDTSSIADATR